MSISRFAPAIVLALSISAALAPTISAQNSTAGQAKELKLEHFDPALVDKSLDPCIDFYK
jgi:hypothetical protein